MGSTTTRGRARRSKTVIPQAPDEFTAAWFTEALAPHAGGATVQRVVTEVIGTDVGFAGEIYRCTLDWDVADGPPRSVIVKVPSQRPGNRAAAEAIGAYEREIRVYRELGDSIGLPMPAHLHSEFTPNPAPWLEPFIRFLFRVLPLRVLGWLTQRAIAIGARSKRRYVLMLEDIVDARPPSQNNGGSTDDARLALTALARFHATNWRRADLLAEHRYVLPINQVPRLRQAGYQTNRSTFMVTFEHSITPSIMDRLDEVQETLADRLDHLASAPCTLLHGDYRLDNILFRPDGEIVVIDPQLVGWGRPAVDIAYFLTTALDPENASDEDDLIRHYHEALVAHGVTDHDLATLRHDVDMSKGVLGHDLVAYTGILDTETADSDVAFTDLVTHRVLGWLAA